MKLVHYVSTVSPQLRALLRAEIDAIDWELEDDADRRSRGVFATSTAIHLRVHKTSTIKPSTIAEWSAIVDTQETQRLKEFPAVEQLLVWMIHQVQGVELGRVMIVNLAPWGGVTPHIDPGEYFKVHRRFHIPIVTNPGVVFGSTLETAAEHMSPWNMYRLMNREMHCVKNNSNQNRTHLIADINTGHQQ